MLGRYWEGGNRLALLFVPIATFLTLLFYGSVANRLAPLAIDAQVLFTYTITLLSIGFSALVSLFALLACRPTEFISRIANTQAFRRVLSNIRTTLLVMSVAIVANFVVGVLKLEPSSVLNVHSVVFVFWCSLTVLTGMLFARTIRLVLVLV